MIHVSGLRLSDESKGEALGANHYAWSAAAENFTLMLDAFKEDWRPMLKPHLVNQSNAQYFDVAPSDLHLSFQSFEYLRHTRACKNIAHVTWEFSQFPDLRQCRAANRINYGHPLEQFISPAILKMNQVWTGCQFTADALKRAGLHDVYTVPAPIVFSEARVKKPPRIVGLQFLDNLYARLSAFSQGLNLYQVNIRRGIFSGLALPPEPQLLKKILEKFSKKVFIFGMIANPHDRRNNLQSAIRGFQIAVSKLGNFDIIFIVKLSCREKPEEIQSLLGALLESSLGTFSNIYFTNDYIPGPKMIDFYRMLDFYLCTSRCEGQNLPLLEAMSQGIIPVSTNNTAMLDYLNQANSFIIPDSPCAVDAFNHPSPLFWGLEWNESAPVDVAEAIFKACMSPAEEILDKSQNCIRMVANSYSPLAIYNKTKDYVLK